MFVIEKSEQGEKSERSRSVAIFCVGFALSEINSVELIWFSFDGVGASAREFMMMDIIIRREFLLPTDGYNSSGSSAGSVFTSV